MADLAWFSARLMLITWYYETASIPREREKHFGTFFIHVHLTVLKLASLEKKKKERKCKFFYFQNSFSWLL